MNQLISTDFAIGENVMQIKRKIIQSKIKRCEKKIDECVKKENYEIAMELIEGLSAVLYNYNQEYTSDFLEQKIEIIANKFPKKKIHKIQNRVLVYDGIGNPQRGILYGYLKALCLAGYEVYYMGDFALDSFDGYHVESIRLVRGGLLERSETIRDVIEKIGPERIFIYTNPYDVSGVIAFMLISGSDRLYINHADHAFWIGKNCFDFCVEFRDYGASISYLYRGIEKNKIKKIEIYPRINQKCVFQGFPFKKKKDDIIFLSGGNVYKTIDKQESFYQLACDILDLNTNIKFWYLGNTVCKSFVRLMKDYKGRFFFSKEREDFFFVLQNADFFINTYPLPGGQMMQYACAAGRIPLTLKHGSDGDGFIKQGGNVKYEFETKDELLAYVLNLLKNPEKKRKIEKEFLNCVIDEKEFSENLRTCISGEEKVKILFYRPHVESLKKNFEENFRLFDFDLFFFNRMNPKVRAIYPFSFLVCVGIHVKVMINKFIYNIWELYEHKKDV